MIFLVQELFQCFDDIYIPPVDTVLSIESNEQINKFEFRGLLERDPVGYNIYLQRKTTSATFDFPALRRCARTLSRATMVGENSSLAEKRLCEAKALGVLLKPRRVLSAPVWISSIFFLPLSALENRSIRARCRAYESVEICKLFRSIRKSPDPSSLLLLLIFYFDKADDDAGQLGESAGSRLAGRVSTSEER